MLVFPSRHPKTITAKEIFLTKYSNVDCLPRAVGGLEPPNLELPLLLFCVGKPATAPTLTLKNLNYTYCETYVMVWGKSFFFLFPAIKILLHLSFSSYEQQDLFV